MRAAIGLISREYPPLTHIGGIGTYSASAARLLAEHGHAVHVFCNGPETRREVEGGVTVHRVRMAPHPLPQGRLSYPYRRWFRQALPNYLEALTWARTVADYVGQTAGALNLAALEYPETNAEGAFLDPANLGAIRRICRIHSSWLYSEGKIETHLLLRLQRRSCALADQVFSPSRRIAEDYARALLGFRGKVEVSPNPLRLWEAPIDWGRKDPGHILFVGRVEHHKGLDLLLAAMDALGEEGRNLTLRVVGPRHPPRTSADAECQAALDRSLNRVPGRGFSLEYAGPCDHASLHLHFDWAGIAVLPSRRDNYPYAALEALSRGCYTLVSDAGGLPETLEGCRGGIFPVGDKDALARKMRELAHGADRVREAWLHNARAMAQRFHPETCYQRLVATYAGESAPEPSPVST